MELTVTSGNPREQRTQCLVAGVFQGGGLTPAAEALDAAGDGRLGKIIASGDIDGSAGSWLLLHGIEGVAAERILLVGLGKPEKFDRSAYIAACGQAIAQLDRTAATECVVYLPEVEVEGCSLADNIRLAGIAAGDRHYRFDRLKSEAEPPEHPVDRLTLAITEPRDTGALEAAARQAGAIVEGMDLARDLGNLPGNICTPAYLAEQARELAERFDAVSVEVLDEAAMEKEGMGALLAVSQGSAQPGHLIALEYRGAGDDERPVALVGKGVTFDSGGISIKPGAGMDEMKYDMGGAAGVLGTLAACAAMALPVNLVVLVPTVENMPSDRALKPGDIVTSLSGQTIEVLNTDAEGRLILCDALTYAGRFDPEVVIDTATLTGACLIALGRKACGVMGNDQELVDALIDAGEHGGDRGWQLPLWDEYQQQLDSNFADMANIGGREAGTITAGCFLARFCQDYDWAHIDIAGTAWVTGKEKGATGKPVPMLTHYLLKRAGLR